MGKELVSEVQDYNDIRIMGAIEDRIMLSTSNLPQMDAVLITTFVLPNTSETGSKELSGVFRKLPEQPVLGRGQPDRTAGHRHAACGVRRAA